MRAARIFAREVMKFIPEFLDRPNVLGIGEIGLNKNSRNEIAVLEKHLELAVERDELLLIHTPHLEDKLKGTRIIIDMIRIIMIIDSYPYSHSYY